MTVACRRCEAENPDGARFCNQCGQPLGAEAPSRETYTPKHLVDRVLRHRSALEGERKRVTVLFADIKGSTALAQQAGAEVWHGVLDRFFAILAESVHRFEGTVNQYTGDGIMALFGAPVAHEDHAQRACLAALAMRDAVRGFADELRLREGLNLSMRIGINSGEVVVGRIGDDLRMDYTAQGLTVNLAARMEQICEPGKIYLAHDTERQVSGYFRLRPLGRMDVDGAPEPVPVAELESAGELVTRLDRQLARGATRFIGREAEFEQLRQLQARAADGDGQIAAVVGHDGIGKSRLCHVFAAECRREGTAVFRATGVPYGNAVPLLPVQNLLRAKMGLDESASREEIRRLVAGTLVLRDAGHARLLPAILGFLGAGEEGTAEASGELQDHVVQALGCWLCETEAPQVLLLEDLHFLDPASEAFVERLCACVAGTRTLLLLNYRPDYVSDWLVPHVDEQIPVTALGRDSLEGLIADAVGDDETLASLVEVICTRANGNPYYAEEAVHALVEQGYLEGVRGDYRLVRPIGEWQVPDSVHALIASRIDRLDSVPREVLHTAAVIGQQFDHPLLQQLLPEHTDLDEQLALLEDAGFVHRRDAGDEAQLAFCHPLVQEVAYQTQLEGRRAAVHRRLAELLSRGLDIETVECDRAVRIAHHWERAGEPARAGHWNVQAGRGLGANDLHVSRDQFRAAIANLDAAEDSPEVLRGRIRARAGLIRSAQFVDVPAEEIDRCFAEAEARAEALGDAPTRAELYISAAIELLHRGQADRAAQLSARATELCVQSGAGELVNRFRVAILNTHNAAGMPRAGIDIANRGAGTAWLERPIDEDNFMSRGFYGGMLMWLGDLEAARRHLVEALAYAQKEDRASSWMHAFKVDLAWFAGEYDEVLSDGRRGLERAETHGSAFFQAVAARGLGLAHVIRGEFAQARDLLSRFEHRVREGEFAYQIEANYLAVQAEALAGLGDFAGAARLADAGIDSGRRCGTRVWELRAWITRLSLPAEVLTEQRLGSGIARMQELIAQSGADGFTPWIAEIRARRCNGRERTRWLEQARVGFERIGARGHAQRLAGALA